MPLPDRDQTPAEFGLAPIFHGQRLEIEEQARRSVVAGGIAALNLCLNLAPNTLAARPESFEPRSARLLGVFDLA